MVKATIPPMIATQTTQTIGIATSFFIPNRPGMTITVYAYHILRIYLLLLCFIANDLD